MSRMAVSFIVPSHPPIDVELWISMEVFEPNKIFTSIIFVANRACIFALNQTMVLLFDYCLLALKSHLH